MPRIVRQLLHPIAKLGRMHPQVLRRLHIRHASIFDQAHSLKLELPRKLPPLHDAPPVPSKHQTRCLRNRVQAIDKFRSSKSLSCQTKNEPENLMLSETGDATTPPPLAF